MNSARLLAQPAVTLAVEMGVPKNGAYDRAY
jgi:hypothetical protein